MIDWLDTAGIFTAGMCAGILLFCAIGMYFKKRGNY